MRPTTFASPRAKIMLEPIVPWLKRHRLWLVPFAYVSMSLLLCAPVLFRDGWPYNHDAAAMFERVESFRKGFRAGAPMPTWDASTYAGFGSPHPLVYHRLFNGLAGALAALSGSVVYSIKLLIPVLLALGAFGTYRAAQAYGISESLAWAAGVLYALAPYTITDWLIRGAVAEFTAGVVVPWLLLLLLEFTSNVRRWIALAVGVVLLFHAHSMICYFFLLPALLLFPLWLGWRRALPRSAADYRHLAIAVSVVLFGIIPHVLAITRVMPALDTDTITRFAVPEEHYVNAFRYLFDESFAWGERWRGFSVELGRYMVLAAVLFALVGLRVRRARPARSTVLLSGLTAIYACFQLPISAPLYTSLPGAAYLQFPWRLNVFLTPLLILLLLGAAQSCLGAAPRRQRWVQAGLVACVLLTLHIPLRALRPSYAWFSEAELSESMAQVTGIGTGFEYLPKGVVWKRLPKHLPLVQSSDCRESIRSAYSGTSLVIDRNGNEACHVSIRQFQLPSLAIELENASLLPPSRHRSIEVLLRAGTSRVTVRPKGVWQLAAEFSTAPGG